MKNSSRTVTLLLIIMSLILSCSDDSPTESTNNDPIMLSVSVSPVSGPPLTNVTINGIDSSDVSDTSIVAYFETYPVPLFLDSSGIVRTAIPVIYDSTTNWTLDSTAISLTIMNINTGDTIAFGENIFELTTLAQAPGTTIQMKSDLSRIANALSELSVWFHDEPSEAEMVTVAFMQAFDTLINGSDSLALTGFLEDLQSTNPDALALLDALIASCGVAEQTEAYADIFEGIADGLAVLQANKTSSTTVLTDEELALRMQLYVILKDYGQTVIGPTASTWSNVTGPIGIFIAIPAVSAIGAVLSLVDFMTNKVLVAMLPAKIDTFTLEFIKDTITVGDTTEAQYEIIASNDPPGITVLDFVGVLLTGMGFNTNVSTAAKIQELDNLRKILGDVANYMLSLFRSGTSAYASAHPTLNLNPSLANLPHMTWSASIEQSKFIELTSFTPTIVEPDPGGFNWAALGPDWDEGRVYTRTTADPSAIVVPQFPGFAYNGGAFGNNIERTETVSIWVKPNLVMELTMPDSVTELSFEPMEIRAGYEIPVTNKNSSGAMSFDTIWSSGISLTLGSSGGSTEHATGVTGTNGAFSSGVMLSSGSQQVSVTIDGQGDVNSESSIQGNVQAQNAIPSIIVYSQSELNNYAGATQASRVYLRRPGGQLNSDISDLTPLANLQELVRDQSSGGPHYILIEYALVSDLSAFSNITDLQDGLYIYNSANVSSLNGFQNVVRAGTIHLANTPITSLSAFSKLEWCLQLNIVGLESLTSLSGLTSLDSIQQNFSIMDGAVNKSGLVNLSGFPNVSYLGGVVLRNSLLTSLSGFPSSITEIGSINGARTGLLIQSNHELTELSALANVEKVYGNVEITGCSELTSVTGLSNLTYIDGNLKIENLPKVDEQATLTWASGITVTGNVTISP